MCHFNDEDKKNTFPQATFLDESISVEHAREHGHTHLSEVIISEFIRFNFA